MKQHHKTITLWIVVILMALLVGRVAMEDKGAYKRIEYPDFVAAVKNERVAEVTLKGDKQIIGLFKEGYEQGKRFTLTGLSVDITHKLLEEHGIVPKIDEPEKQTFFASLLINWGPILILIVIFYFFLRQIQAGGGKAMSFGKSKAKMLSANDKKVTFKDVSGCLLYTSPSPRDVEESRMPSSA